MKFEAQEKRRFSYRTLCISYAGKGRSLRSMIINALIIKHYTTSLTTLENPPLQALD